MPQAQNTGWTDYTPTKPQAQPQAQGGWQDYAPAQQAKPQPTTQAEIDKTMGSTSMWGQIPRQFSLNGTGSTLWRELKGAGQGFTGVLNPKTYEHPYENIVKPVGSAISDYGLAPKALGGRGIGHMAPYMTTENALEVAPEAIGQAGGTVIGGKVLSIGGGAAARALAKNGVPIPTTGAGGAAMRAVGLDARPGSIVEDVGNPHKTFAKWTRTEGGTGALKRPVAGAMTIMGGAAPLLTKGPYGIFEVPFGAEYGPRIAERVLPRLEPTEEQIINKGVERGTRAAEIRSRVKAAQEGAAPEESKFERPHPNPKGVIVSPESKAPVTKVTYQSVPQADLLNMVKSGDRDAISEWQRRGLPAPPNVRLVAGGWGKL